MPPTCFLGALILMVALHFGFPLRTLLPFPHGLWGLAPLAIGILLNGLADHAFKRVGSTVKPFEESTQLITDGVFGLTRHPMYLGMTLILLGVAGLLGSATPFLALIPFVWVINGFMAMEERKMEATFGQAYREHMRRVRRWI
ncbi:isoprenylcysteine carboxylmethyltransferase family protein [Candidatus Sumerlaeota bacterium]|nr:isoprenylcysteine carboxylmethyltransferase family protein [Candidatus Sumerlaeota bacterium]